MERLFISYHFDQPGKALADMVQSLVASHSLLPVTGERLGEGALSAAVMDAIKPCDGLICLLTEQASHVNHDWVKDERAFAGGSGKRVLSIVQNGTNDGGLYGEHEQVRYQPEDPLPAFLKLSGILGDWRRKSGRFVRALLQPADVAARAHAEHAEVRYRCWERDEPSGWRSAVSQKTGHSETVTFLKDVPEGAQIEVRLSHNGQVWESGAHEQLLNIRLDVFK